MTRYSGTVAKFLAALGSAKDFPLESLDAEHYETFVKQELSRGLTEKSVSNDLKCLKIPLNRAVSRGRLPASPAAAISVIGRSEGRESFQISEVNLLLQALDLPGLPLHIVDLRTEWKTAILLATYAGMRIGDVVKLQWDSVDFQQKYIRWIPEKLEKSGREVVVPFHPRLEAHLNALPLPQKGATAVSPVMNSRDTGNHSWLNDQFHILMKLAGVQQRQGKKKEGAGRQVNKKTFHSLRHTFTSMMANAGIPAEVRMKLTGHVDEDVHALYTHLDQPLLRGAIAALPEQ